MIIPEKTIERALSAPQAVITYVLSNELAVLLDGKGFIETSDSDFDVEDFARHGQCELSVAPAPRPLRSRQWSGSRASDAISLAMFDVTWNDAHLEVLTVSWQTSCGSDDRTWIIAESRELAASFFDAVCSFCVEPHREVLVFEEGYWAKSEELFSAVEGTSLDALVLAPGLKEELRRDVETFFSSEPRYAMYSVPWKRGLLLTGPPGNGKTHAIKGLISELDRPCLYARSFACEGTSDQRNIREVFRKARSAAPCLLVLEDLDSMVTDENRAFFLNELDGFARNDGILVVATTNHPERLDPAIVDRPSRFDRKYLFDVPAVAERRAYLMRWNQSLQPALRAGDGALELAAERTNGFSFAYLKELALSSVMRWADEMKSGSMDAILPAAVELLRKQVKATAPDES
jgi:hypothetical protein